MVPKLATLTHGEQFVYEFDFADRGTHLYTAAPTRIPRQNWESFRAVGCRIGGETIPDQNGRRWADDDEEHDEPPNPGSDPLTSAAHDGAPKYGVKRPCRWPPRTVRAPQVRGR
jgi:hypothetical protein